MEQTSHGAESRDRDEAPPLERELAGLPELDRFTSEGDRAAALRAVHRRIEDPYTLGYWIWVAVLICAAIAVARLIGWGLKVVGTPSPFPAVLSILAGVAAYMLLYRLIIRWAARPELQRELAERGHKDRSARQAAP
jgi:hypothetical protein